LASQDNLALARKLYERFNSGDLDGARALELTTEDALVELVPFAMTFHGREGFRQFMGGFKQAFPDLTVTVTNQVASEDQVVSECTWTGTHSGPLGTPTGEIPATGRSVRNGRFCEVWGVRDGKMSSLRNYQDPGSWLRELGLGA
jgi:steroid delta-isomerase-like uncharacterized protein